eukprot:192789-Chlamydomonas_euryale.AAC.1
MPTHPFTSTALRIYPPVLVQHKHERRHHEHGHKQRDRQHDAPEEEQQPAQLVNQAGAALRGHGHV